MGNNRNSQTNTCMRWSTNGKKSSVASPRTANSPLSASDSDDECDEVSGDEMDVECPNCGVFCRCRQSILLQGEKSEGDDYEATEIEELHRGSGFSDRSESIQSVGLQNENTVFAIEIPSAATTDSDMSEQDFLFDEDLSMIAPLPRTTQSDGLAVEEVELLFHSSDSDDADDESTEDFVGWDCFLTDSDSVNGGSGATTDDEGCIAPPHHAPPPEWLCSPRTIVTTGECCGRAPPLLASWTWPCDAAYNLLDGSCTVYVLPPPPAPPPAPLPQPSTARTASPDIGLFFELPPDSLSASNIPEHRDLRRWDRIPINAFRTRQQPSSSPRHGILKSAPPKRRHKRFKQQRRKKSRVAKRNDLLETKSLRDFKGETAALGIELSPLFGSFDV